MPTHEMLELVALEAALVFEWLQTDWALRKTGFYAESIMKWRNI